MGSITAKMVQEDYFEVDFTSKLREIYIETKCACQEERAKKLEEISGEEFEDKMKLKLKRKEEKLRNSEEGGTQERKRKLDRFDYLKGREVEIFYNNMKNQLNFVEEFVESKLGIYYIIRKELPQNEDIPNLKLCIPYPLIEKIVFLELLKYQESKPKSKTLEDVKEIAASDVLIKQIQLHNKEKFKGIEHYEIENAETLNQKSYDINLPIYGSIKKRIRIENEGETKVKYQVHCSNPNVIEIKENQIKIGSQSSKYLRFKVIGTQTPISTKCVISCMNTSRKQITLKIILNINIVDYKELHQMEELVGESRPSAPQKVEDLQKEVAKIKIKKEKKGKDKKPKKEKNKDKKSKKDKEKKKDKKKKEKEKENENEKEKENILDKSKTESTDKMEQDKKAEKLEDSEKKVEESKTSVIEGKSNIEDENIKAEKPTQNEKVEEQHKKDLEEKSAVENIKNIKENDDLSENVKSVDKESEIVAKVDAAVINDKLEDKKEEPTNTENIVVAKEDEQNPKLSSENKEESKGKAEEENCIKQDKIEIRETDQILEIEKENSKEDQTKVQKKDQNEVKINIEEEEKKEVKIEGETALEIKNAQTASPISKEIYNGKDKDGQIKVDESTLEPENTGKDEKLVKIEKLEEKNKNIEKKVEEHGSESNIIEEERVNMGEVARENKEEKEEKLKSNEKGGDVKKSNSEEEVKDIGAEMESGKGEENEDKKDRNIKTIKTIKREEMKDISQKEIKEEGEKNNIKIVDKVKVLTENGGNLEESTRNYDY